MPSYTDDIKNVLIRLSNDVTSMDMLLEFERTLDNVHLYAYENWINGEIVQGPNITKYWFSCTLMYPFSMQPDFEGAKRLEKYGCKVSMKEDVFNNPVKILTKNDYADQKNKKAKMKKHRVWLVTIDMPRKFIDEQIEDFIVGKNDVGVDTSDISSAYDKDIQNPDELDMGDTGEDMSGEDLGGLE